MSSAFVPHRARKWLWHLCLPALLVVLSSCSFLGLGATPAKPAVWTNYQGKMFAMNYFTDWDVATKDMYLGTSYPQLELLQGMVFANQGSPTTFVQVVYAGSTTGDASISDLLRKHILGTDSQPLAAANLTNTTLAGVTWSQGVVEKQISSTGSPGGSQVQVKETALGVSYPVKANQTEVYLIIYQDATSTYDQTNHDFFTRMMNSFHFVAAK